MKNPVKNPLTSPFYPLSRVVSAARLLGADSGEELEAFLEARRAQRRQLSIEIDAALDALETRVQPRKAMSLAQVMRFSK